MINAMKSKSIINSVVGFFSQIIIVALGFVVPRLVLSNYGSDTNGVINTVTQIFTYLALLEAGISQAAQNAVYPHLVKNDRKKISTVISVARRYFRNISYIYALFMLIIAFVLPLVLKTQVDYWTIFFYVFFEGLTSLVSFYFTSTWSTLLFADGKTYVINLINLLIKVLCYTVRIVLIILNFNIAFIQIGYFLVSLIQLLIYYLYMKKNYFWVEYNLASKSEKLPDRNSYVITEMAWTIFSSTDMIVLSIFVSTSLSSVYSIYSMVFVALESLLNSIYNSVKYILGQSYNKDLQYYKRVHNLFNSIFVGGITILVSVAYWLIIPFIKLYTEGITDIRYVYTWLPLLFCLVPLISRNRSIAGTLTGLAGYAKKVSYISIAEAITNIVLSIILVQFWGIFGVLIATICALPIKVVYVNYLSEIIILKRSPLKTLLIFGVNYLVFGTTVFLNYIIPINVESYLSFILYGFMLFFIYFIVVFSLNILVNKDLVLIWKKLSNVNKEK